NFVFAQPPLVNGVRDMAIGGPLDILFNNGICLSGTKNFCAQDSFHIPSQALNVILPPQVNVNANSVSFAPAPNPPKLGLTPLCAQPFIGGIEPISVINVPPATAHNTSTLKPGNLLGNPIGGTSPRSEEHPSSLQS